MIHQHPTWHVWRAAVACVILLSGGTATTADAGGARLDQLPRSWRDELGRPVAFTDLIGQRVILSMAYTRCHNTCPATLLQLQRMQQVLDTRGEQASFVIVGYDTQDDDPASWRQYQSNRRLARGNWHFLSGTPQAVRQLARQLGFEYWNYDTHVMHDSRIVFFDSQGQVSGVVAPATGDWSALL